MHQSHAQAMLLQPDNDRSRRRGEGGWQLVLSTQGINNPIKHAEAATALD